MFYINKERELDIQLLSKMINRFRLKVEPKLTKYKNLQKLLMERDLRYWQVAAKVFMPERTFRYKMSEKSPGFYSAEMFRIQRNVFPDKTIEEIFGE